MRHIIEPCAVIVIVMLAEKQRKKALQFFTEGALNWELLLRLEVITQPNEQVMAINASVDITRKRCICCTKILIPPRKGDVLGDIVSDTGHYLISENGIV